MASLKRADVPLTKSRLTQSYSGMVRYKNDRSQEVVPTNL